MPEEMFDKLPSDMWFLSRGFLPDKVRLALKSIEAPIIFKDWVVIALPPQYFFNLAAIITEQAKNLSKK